MEWKKKKHKNLFGGIPKVWIKIWISDGMEEK